MYVLHISLNTLIIENVQRRFTKWIRFISDLPYLERLALAVMDLEPLELRRIKSDLTMYFKINNNLSALPSNYLTGDNSIRTYYSRRKCGYLGLIQPFCRTQLFANDFFNRCVHCFNSLPESVVSSKTVAEFKRRLSDIDLSAFLRYNFNNSIGYT